jgi:hypothetical protein
MYEANSVFQNSSSPWSALFGDSHEITGISGGGTRTGISCAIIIVVDRLATPIYSFRTQQMETIQVKLSDKVVTAEVLRINPKTLWVRLPDGKIIKRHKDKHLIKL